jgi:hypothetical protein
MDRRWTKRGVITEEDKKVITSIVGLNKVASRIFITGEVYEGIFNETPGTVLIGANDALKEPLFVMTKEKTVQMTRFDPEVVWKLINPKTLEELMALEETRLGVGNIAIDEYDFYGSMVMHMQTQYGHVSVPMTDKDDFDSFYQTMYMSCLWCYGKGGYMSVPVSRHFALPEAVKYMKNEFNTRALSTEEMTELEGLQKKYAGVQGITNPELDFLAKLHDAGR